VRRGLLFACAAVVVVVAAGCGHDQHYIPAGTFSGTVGAHQKITIVSGHRPVVNGVKGAWDKNGVIVVKKSGFELSCLTLAKGDELHCTASPLGRSSDIPTTAPFDLVRI